MVGDSGSGYGGEETGGLRVENLGPAAASVSSRRRTPRCSKKTEEDFLKSRPGIATESHLEPPTSARLRLMDEVRGEGVRLE